MVKTIFVEDCLFKGTVFHERFVPIKHKFEYKMVYFWLNILPKKKFKLINFDTPSLFNFNSFDFGCSKRTNFSSLFEYWKSELKKFYDYDIQTIKVLCLPRIFNYSFNPITVFVCFDKNKTAKILIFEVRNTFGEKHAYISQINNKSLRTKKKFHVSPFLKTKGDYSIEFSVTDKIVNLNITYYVKKKKVLYACFKGKKIELTNINVFLVFCKNFFQNFIVTVGIHIEALKLWIKGAIYVNKPKPPKKFMSKID